MYLAVCRELRALGFERYEISNFCTPGMRSRHNMKYWLREDYLGIGPSAHSFMDGRRFYAPSELDSFISSPMQTELEEGSVDPLEEYVMLSLRLIDGLSYSELGSLGGDADAASKRAEKFVGGGLAESDGRRLWLTDQRCACVKRSNTRDVSCCVRRGGVILRKMLCQTITPA